MGTIKKLLEDGKISQDHWLALADVKNENVETYVGNIIWHGGEWRGNKSSPIRCKHHIMTDENGLITIGCEARTIKEWDEFFASDEVLETPRDTEAFRLIERAYQAARAAVIFEKQIPEPQD